jgi:hypothetical protein
MAGDGVVSLAKQGAACTVCEGYLTKPGIGQILAGANLVLSGILRVRRVSPQGEFLSLEVLVLCQSGRASLLQLDCAARAARHGNPR